MTRTELQRLLAAAVARRQITAERSAQLLAQFDAGTLTPEQIAALRADKPPRGGGYIYDPAARRYSRAGRTLTPEQVRDALDAALDNSEPEMVRVTEELRDGRITLAEWQRRMERMIGVRVLGSSALGLGGFDQMNDADRRHIGRQIAEQLRFLRGFARDILTGKQPLNGRALARAKQYAQAPRGIFESIRGRAAELVGFTEERRYLGGADHCSTVGPLRGCLELAALGWRPIGTLPRIGGAPCRSNCRCRFAFRRAS